MPTDTLSDPRELALPLQHADDLDPLLDRIGNARVVCIGEASHGTHEYYAWRARLTQRLVEERGFDFVAVEGDWPDCHAVHCSVTGHGSAPDDPREALHEFARWPTWMWANEEVVDFTRWLRSLNLERPAEDRVGFYGLDVYSLWESLRAVLDHLRAHHPQHVDAALEACRCFEPYAEDPQATPAPPGWCRPIVNSRSSACCPSWSPGTRTPRRTTRTPRSPPTRTPAPWWARRPTTAPWCRADRSPGTSATGTWSTPWTG